ncbi:hypothetical protein ACLMJK_001965 [Lecanora helva]
MSESVYSSPPFKFVIDGKPFYIHKELASCHSKPLDRMMNGYLAEAQQGSAVLNEIHFETFNRFIQWAYVGYYSPADFHIAGRSTDDGVGEKGNVRPAATGLRTSDLSVPLDHEPFPTPSDHDEDDSGWTWPSKSSKKGKRGTPWKRDSNIDFDPVPTIPQQSSRDKLKKSFISRKTTIRTESIAITPLRSNKNDQEDYTEVFLSHACLYVFAEMYDIQPLKALALDNLHGTLAIFTLYKARTGDIIELLRYIYGAMQSVPGVDELRSLMKEYVAYEMDMLMQDANLSKLMVEDGGALLEDYMEMVAKRI